MWLAQLTVLSQTDHSCWSKDILFLGQFQGEHSEKIKTIKALSPVQQEQNSYMP